MTTKVLKDIFKTVDKEQDETVRQLNSMRDKFLSRVFGIFSEKIVSIWCKLPSENKYKNYENLGRPTILYNGKRFTLDFTLKNPEGIYVAEMKCELEYDSYKHLTLENSCQLDHHSKVAFKDVFLGMANDPKKFKISISGHSHDIADGVILIWGSLSDEGLKSIRAHEIYSKIHDVLSLEEMIKDLNAANDLSYLDFIKNHQIWSNCLFNDLKQINR